MDSQRELRDALRCAIRRAPIRGARRFIVYDLTADADGEGYRLEVTDDLGDVRGASIIIDIDVDSVQEPADEDFVRRLWAGGDIDLDELAYGLLAGEDVPWLEGDDSR